MADPSVPFPREYRPVAGGALAVVVFAWVMVIGSAVFTFGAWRFLGWAEDKSSGSGVLVATVMIGGLLVFAAAWGATGLCFLFWRGRVRWNAKLAVGPTWSGRRRPLSLNDVRNASDPVGRSAARVDRPRHPSFPVWLLSYIALVLVMASFWYVGRENDGTEFAWFAARLAVVHTVVAVVFAVSATAGVRTITLRQTDPAMYTGVQV
ncbi:MAG TPA: hypothetical protein VNO31_30005 [Umezawaea sp.]|nr:hypothetical protein [Umezawaea sp.]